MTPDPLTCLPTHEAVAEMLGDGSTPFGVIFDIDGLAHDTAAFGHAHSDRILVCVAAQADEAARGHPGARAFRIGGDEFLVVLPGATHDEAAAFARSVLSGVAALRLEYARSDAPDGRHVAVNAVVGRVAAALAARVRAVREWAAERIWDAKGHDPRRVEVVADAGESLPPWAG